MRMNSPTAREMYKRIHATIRVQPMTRMDGDNAIYRVNALEVAVVPTPLLYTGYAFEFDIGQTTFTLAKRDRPHSVMNTLLASMAMYSRKIDTFEYVWFGPEPTERDLTQMRLYL